METLTSRPFALCAGADKAEQALAKGLRAEVLVHAAAGGWTTRAAAQLFVAPSRRHSAAFVLVVLVESPLRMPLRTLFVCAISAARRLLRPL